MWLRREWSVACVVGALAMTGAVARAQPPEGPDASEDATEGEDETTEGGVTERDEEARGLFLAGSAAFQRGHYEEALDYFQRAYELSGRARMLFNIGHTAERLRRDELALRSFERYLRDVPEAENRTSVEARVRLLREAIASSEPRGDAEPETETSEAIGDASDAPPPGEPGGGGGPSAGPFVLMGVGGAAAVAGIVLLALASSAAAQVDGAADGTPWVDVEGDYESAGTMGIAGGVTLGVGAALVVAGVTWLGIELASGGSEDVALRVGPGGLDLRGSF